MNGFKFVLVMAALAIISCGAQKKDAKDSRLSDADIECIKKNTSGAGCGNKTVTVTTTSSTNTSGN